MSTIVYDGGRVAAWPRGRVAVWPKSISADVYHCLRRWPQPKGQEPQKLSHGPSLVAFTDDSV